MTVLNELDRFHLVLSALDRLPGLGESAAGLRTLLMDKLAMHRRHIREHGEDMPEIRNWKWQREAQKCQTSD
jgi:xylulose-5-phosphate/fructose-6-phosphate phosphoketolase